MYNDLIFIMSDGEWKPHGTNVDLKKPASKRATKCISSIAPGPETNCTSCVPDVDHDRFAVRRFRAPRDNAIDTSELWAVSLLT